MHARIGWLVVLALPWLAAVDSCADLGETKGTTDSGGISLGDDDDTTLPGDDDDDDDNNGDDDDDDDDDNAGGGCESLFTTADERLDPSQIQCIEGTFEERGYDFDANACDNLEDALSVGFGPFDLLWVDCQSAEGFGDADCDAVYASCL